MNGTLEGLTALPKHYLRGAHGLRGFATLAVFFYHCIGLAEKDGFKPSGGLFDLANFIQLSGYAGVFLFFMLSGFIIMESALKEHRALPFFIKRLIRIYCVFLVTHLLIFAVGPFINYNRFVGIDLRGYVSLFLTNIFLLNAYYGSGVESGNVQPVTWSVAQEMVFYGVTALAIAIASRTFPSAQKHPRVWLLPLLVSSAIFLLILGGALRWTAVFFIPGILYRRFCGWIDSAYDFFPILKKPSLYFLAAWVLFFYLYFEYFRVGYYLNLLGWIVCVAACVSAMLFWASIVGGYGLPYRILTSRVLIFLGTISYSMYLWQTIVMYPLRYIVRSFSVEGVGAPAAYGIFVVSSLLITLIVSSLSYFLLEVRFARAMRRLMLPR